MAKMTLRGRSRRNNGRRFQRLQLRHLRAFIRPPANAHGNGATRLRMDGWQRALMESRFEGLFPGRGMGIVITSLLF